jgi:DNA-binding NtrC family response regulator
MVGESPPMQKLFALMRRVAPSDSTVLVRGESGTGKELVARALHRNSRRAEGPFVALNCATLSPTLLESELFGHERGAFTGATGRRIGKLETADGGTLFLDEVGEIPVDLQARLLRVLQEREFERVGGNRPIPVNVRLIAATNRDLEAAIAEGTFREDLFYRLDVITLHLPPLRQRTGDIPRLAEHLLSAHARNQGRARLHLSPEAMDCLGAYSWPGNVRELSNALERAVVLTEGERIESEDLPESVVEAAARLRPEDGAAKTYEEGVTATKKRLVREALAEAEGNFALAAERLGLRRTSLHRLVSNLGLRDELDP